MALQAFNPVGAFQGARRNALAIQQQQQAIDAEEMARPRRNALSDLQIAGASKGNTLTDLKLTAAQNQAARQSVVEDMQDTQFDQGQALQRAGLMHQVTRALRGLPVAQRPAAMATLAPEMEKFGIPEVPVEKLTDESLDVGIAATGGMANVLRDQSRKLQSSKILDDGSTVMNFSNGDRVVTDPSGNVVSGADAARTVKDAQKFGADLQGERSRERKLATSGVDLGNEMFAKIEPLRTSIRNIDRAMQALKDGAETGPIAAMLPSTKRATVELDNVRKRMGLDVIGATTFGALSESELNFALDSALPTSLDEEDLIRWLTLQKTAQEQMLRYTESAAQYLLSGGKIQDFVKEQAIMRKLAEAPEENGVIMEDAQGNRALVNPETNKVIREL